MAATDDEGSLLARARRGDRDALAALLCACEPELLRYARLRLGPGLRGSVEPADVVQEALARALRSFGELVGDESDLLRWLRGIAEHVILEAARRGRRDAWAPLGPEPARDDPSPSRNLRRQERFERLRAALERLPAEHREAISLSRLHGLKLKDIASRLGKSPNAVAHLISRGLKQLREELGDTASLHLPPRSLEEGETNDKA